MEQMYRPIDVQEILSLSKTTVHRMLKSGELRSYRVRGTTLIAESDVASLLNSSRVDPQDREHFEDQALRSRYPSWWDGDLEEDPEDEEKRSSWWGTSSGWWVTAEYEQDLDQIGDEE